ncbi:MAG: phytoene desaturase family protein [Oligoflexales bacterium]
MAHLALYIGLKGTAKELGLRTTNLWIYSDENHDKNLSSFLNTENQKLPVVYISFPSAKDPSWQDNYPGKSTIEIIAPVSYDWFKKWEGTKWQKRGTEYNAYKKEMSDILLGYLFQKHPNLRDKIDYVELSTPLSTAHFSNYHQGQIYGINHTPDRFKEKWLRANTPIKNLYLTGQDIVTCGVGGALCAGVLTAIATLGLFHGFSLVKLMIPTRSRKLGQM